MIIASYEVFTPEGILGFSTLGPALEAAWDESKKRSGAGVEVRVQHEGSAITTPFATVFADLL